MSWNHFFINFFFFLSPQPTASPSCPRTLRLQPPPPVPATLPARRRHRTPRLLWFGALEGPLPWTCGLLPPGVRPTHLPLPMTWRQLNMFISEPPPFTLLPSSCTCPIIFWGAVTELLNVLLTPPTSPVMPPVNHKPRPISCYGLINHFPPTPLLFKNM